MKSTFRRGYAMAARADGMAATRERIVQAIAGATARPPDGELDADQRQEHRCRQDDDLRSGHALDSIGLS